MESGLKKLHERDLVSIDLSFRQLRHAGLEDTWLAGAKLVHTDLEDADLRFATLENADLRGGCLKHANLCGASLAHAKTEGASFQGAFFNENTKLPFSRADALKKGMIFVINL